ncbi:MAG: hypothetical protein EOO15_10835 [Chitinophagaceae bacterium]|nr:MAG: hypothetical protein EOO15_10835 [Chitinophagaceae bacterium]
MRLRNYAIALLLLTAACKKNNDEEAPAPTGPTGPTGPNVSSASLTAQMAAGGFTVYNRYTINVSSLQPTTGTGQTWNYSALTSGVVDTMRFVAASNPTFGAATYLRNQLVDFGVGGNTQVINLSTYYQVSPAGWFELGHSMPAVNFVVPATATINFAAQSNVYTPAPNRMPLTPALPAYVGDSVSFTSIIQDSGRVTAPNFFLSNTPVSVKTTNSGVVKVAGSGALQMPGASAAVNAVLITRTYTRVNNFLLNGTTPPVQLLGMLGITDGQSTAVVAYDFYGQGNEGYLGSIYRENGTTLYAYFRKQ